MRVVGLTFSEKQRKRPAQEIKKEDKKPGSKEK
nr:MAG TPA: hypothetical protein [Caudoviricetes sp.]